MLHYCWIVIRCMLHCTKLCSTTAHCLVHNVLALFIHTLSEVLPEYLKHLKYLISSRFLIATIISQTTNRACLLRISGQFCSIFFCPFIALILAIFSLCSPTQAFVSPICASNGIKLEITAIPLLSQLIL